MIYILAVTRPPALTVRQKKTKEVPWLSTTSSSSSERCVRVFANRRQPNLGGDKHHDPRVTHATDVTDVPRVTHATHDDYAADVNHFTDATDIVGLADVTDGTDDTGATADTHVTEVCRTRFLKASGQSFFRKYRWFRRAAVRRKMVNHYYDTRYQVLLNTTSSSTSIQL